MDSGGGEGLACGSGRCLQIAQIAGLGTVARADEEWWRSVS
jgi:hypothetical protein